MKKLNGLFALLLILAAVFCLTACPQPADPDPDPEVTPEPTPTFDYSKYAIPSDIDSWDNSNWTHVDVSGTNFDKNRLKDTEWILIEFNSDRDEGIIIDTTSASIYSINATVDDASSKIMVTQIFSKEDESDFTQDEISDLTKDLEDMKNSQPGVNMEITTGKKKIMMEATMDMGSDMTNGDGTSMKVIDFINMAWSIDKSNTYVRWSRLGGYNYAVKL